MASLFATVGFITLAYLFFRLATWAYRTFFHTANIARYCPRGTWAVVTGCTDGIGKGFVLEIAKKAGLNLVLVSRNKEKLDLLAQEIKDTFHVETKSVAIDFTTATDFSSLSEAIEDLTVTCLINNVGVNSECPAKFMDLSDKEISDMINVNIKGTLTVTRIVLPKLLEVKKGIIVNLGSYTGVLPTPLLGVYSATKSFIDSWTKVLRAEYASSNLEIVSITPFYVVSAMSGFKKPSFTVCSSTRLASDTLRAIGAIGAPSTFSAHYSHAIMEFLLGLLPEFLYMKIAGGSMQKVRARYLKKNEKRE